MCHAPTKPHNKWGGLELGGFERPSCSAEEKRERERERGRERQREGGRDTET